ncbi:MAG: DUF4411 family protein [Planctomycetes bacterium]|nr:DUF4411 family protein [Planctomycetota bacterium]
MRKYSLDTSAILEAWHRRYPIDVFPSIWAKLDEWAAAERILISEEVLHELKRKEDDAYRWVHERKSLLVVPTDETIIQAGASIVTQFQHLVKEGKGRHAADPWMIAVARLHQAVVVSEESRGKGPKIPHVCDELEIQHTNLLGFVRATELRL